MKNNNAKNNVEDKNLTNDIRSILHGVGRFSCSAGSQEKVLHNRRAILTQKSGITLIALIITIIILLILAGVVINLAIDENGIMNMAKQAGEDYKIASVKERVEEEIMALEADKIVKGEKLTVEQALIGIEEKEVFEEIDLAEEIGISEGYEIKLGYNEFGNVIILGIEKEIGIRIVTDATPKGYTNQDVIVEISVKPEGTKISNIEVPESMIKQADGTYKISKNGTYLVKATLEDGTSVEKEIKINTIDKLPPKDFTITAQNTEEGFIIIGTTQEEEETSENACSGIDRYEYVITNEEGKETKYTESEIKGLEIGTYQIYAIAYDKAGNFIKTKVITCKIANKYQIYNEQDLKNIKLDLEGNYYIMNDIEVGSTWTTITDEFVGNLEGNNCTINFNNINNGVMFTRVKGCIKNLKIKGTINGPVLTYNQGVIENVVLNTVVRNNVDNSGGLARYNMKEIRNCDVRFRCMFEDAGKKYQGSVNNIGGVACVNQGTIEKCKIDIRVNLCWDSNRYGYAGSNIGGVVSENLGVIKNCYTEGSIVGSYYLGGIASKNSGDIINCYNRCYIQANSSVAGAEPIAHSGNGRTVSCYWCEVDLWERHRGYVKNEGERTEEELRDVNTYKGWDFESGEVWIMNEYPKLIF